MSSIAGQLIHHERFTTVHAVLQQTLERTRQGDSQIVPIVGPTRVGKSKLLARFADSVKSPGADPKSRKVVCVMTPKHLTSRAVIDACLLAVGMSPGLFKNHGEATHAFVRALNKHGTELIVFDETQHMLERGTSIKQRDAADLLKGIFDQTAASIVLAGLPTLLGLFQHNEQLADRARAAVEFYPYFWEGPDFGRFRGALAGALGFFAESGWQIRSTTTEGLSRRPMSQSTQRRTQSLRILPSLHSLKNTCKSETGREDER